MAETHARLTDPDTSHAAASAVDGARQRSIKARLHAAFQAHPGGLTADEAARIAGFTKADGAWKRVSDLARDGLIEDTFIRRPGDSGRGQIVWGVVDD